MTTFYTIKGIDPQLWRQVKSLCALRGISIKQLIFNLLKKEIKENNTKS